MHATFLENIDNISILFLKMFLFNHILTRNRPYIRCHKHICAFHCRACNPNGIFNINPDLIKILSQTHSITCKCISSYNLCTSFNIFFMNCQHSVRCLRISKLRKTSCIILFFIVSTKRSVSCQSFAL